mmetsp:Transcript_22772/g.56227  ORF Transcript_22772/g.56227 Transcript_22772/m.56227 type:complete len:144 (+) Transcript_22772:274-705(+)
MTYLQAVFSLHAIFCYFYGGVTFFNPEITVAMGLIHPDWSTSQFAVLMKMQGACVLGLGLVCISAAQFEEADPRNMIARCMLGMFALLFITMWQDLRDGGKSQLLVVAGVGITTVAYLIGCTLLLDTEKAKDGVGEAEKPKTE